MKHFLNSQSQQYRVVRRHNECLSTNYLQRYRFSRMCEDGMALGADLA
jgi:hypothetical protein